MNSKWFYNLTETEKEELERDFKASALLRERLAAVLSREVEQSLREMRDVARFGNVPNLTEYYADELSRQRTLEWVLKLIK